MSAGSPEPAASAPLPSSTQRRPNPRVAQLKRTFYFLRRNTLAMIGLGILVFLIGVAVGSVFYNAPGDQLQTYCGSDTGNGVGLVGSSNASGCDHVVCTYPYNTPAPSANCFPVDPNQVSVLPPTDFSHGLSLGPFPFGSLTTTADTNEFYNLFAGMVKGAPWSLGISAVVVVSGSMIGLFLGASAGYLGGYTDESIMRATDIFLSIPGLLLLIVILSTAGSIFPTFWGHLEILIVAFIATDWPIYTRIVRSQVLVTREQKFVEASRASGARTSRILRKHIIPNSVYPMFVQMSLDIGTIPLGLATLVFLGFSIFPHVAFPEWGSITAQSVGILASTLQYCQEFSGCLFPWWQFFIPGTALFVFAISVSFFSDGLRDALDPRLRR
ncbi:MAG: ABC transporter permease [Thermoplasmata archaeon]|nr:ABC transporter permease [Thermoplasmata archaeon]